MDATTNVDVVTWLMAIADDAEFFLLLVVTIVMWLSSRSIYPRCPRWMPAFLGIAVPFNFFHRLATFRSEGADIIADVMRAVLVASFCGAVLRIVVGTFALVLTLIRAKLARARAEQRNRHEQEQRRKDDEERQRQSETPVEEPLSRDEQIRAGVAQARIDRDAELEAIRNAGLDPAHQKILETRVAQRLLRRLHEILE